MTDTPTAPAVELDTPCSRCDEREAVMEDNRGEPVCQHCMEVLADRAYERMKDRD